MDKKEEYKLLIDTATLAGKLMLENGAEIYRVEDTIRRMLAVSRLKTGESYVTNTGIMVNLDDPSVDSMTVIRRISSRNMDLNMISLVNNISREFCAGNMDLKEAFHELKHLDGRQYSKLMIDLSIVGVAGFFALVFGGGFRDAITAGVDGALIALMLRFSKRLRLNGFIETVLCSVVLAAGAVLMAETGTSVRTRSSSVRLCPSYPELHLPRRSGTSCRETMWRAGQKPWKRLLRWRRSW